MWTDDPIRDFDRHDARLQKSLSRFPICFECGEPIQAEEFYEFDHGRCICPTCLENNHMRWTEDFIG